MTPGPGSALSGDETADSKPQPVRLFVVEDHALLREGTIDFLERDPMLRVVGQAATAEEALEPICDLNPDLVLVDIELPGMTGIDLVRAVGQRAPHIRFLILTAYDDHAYVTEALEAGVGGYLLKTVGRRELVDAVRIVAEGRVVLDVAVTKQLRRSGTTVRGGTWMGLTPREQDVLALIAHGRTNKQIALELTLGRRTVESHVSSLLTKLGLASRTEAALFALDHHLVVSSARPVQQ